VISVNRSIQKCDAEKRARRDRNGIVDGFAYPKDSHVRALNKLFNKLLERNVDRQPHVVFLEAGQSGPWTCDVIRIRELVFLIEWIPHHLSPIALVASTPRERNVGTVRRGRSAGGSHLMRILISIRQSSARNNNQEHES
jgi:hypothetical protein